ncbi:hypothetical protein J6590_024717 [Homalodisca vitripennis]|nr:hypothetical protein J6590_024717 [Homalodisca vitripennis]
MSKRCLHLDALVDSQELYISVALTSVKVMMGGGGESLLLLWGEKLEAMPSSFFEDGVISRVPPVNVLLLYSVQYVSTESTPEQKLGHTHSRSVS